jgi:hypothetical protein
MISRVSFIDVEESLRKFSKYSADTSFTLSREMLGSDP